MDNGLQTLSGVLRGLPAVEYEVKVPEEGDVFFLYPWCHS